MESKKGAAMSEPVLVFVSYASKDRPFAERLVTDLQAAGAEVWWDVGGVSEGDFIKRINEALQKCQWFVLVLTPNAIASWWVEAEVNAAINLRKHNYMRGVLPVLAAPVQPGTIPPVWDNLHRYDAVSNYSGEINRLISTLGLPAERADQQTLPQERLAPRSPVGMAVPVAGNEEADQSDNTNEVGHANAPRVDTLLVRPLPGTNGGKVREFELDGHTIAIGRSPTCDVVLQDDQLVSRRHALLRSNGSEYTIVDLGSSNGTFINEEEIHEETTLRDGDMIAIGEYEILYLANRRVRGAS
jgi:pSer/pThr/pTyr-binding forkhead associated (FHA) protein